MPLTAPTDEALDCDVSRRFIRVLGRHANGLIAFSFAIGWPELSVDLMLPEADFDAFCASHGLHARALIATHDIHGDKHP